MAVMQQEIDALQDNHARELVTLPYDTRSIGCKWVYKVKYNSVGLDKYKERLVVKRYWFYKNIFVCFKDGDITGGVEYRNFTKLVYVSNGYE